MTPLAKNEGAYQSRFWPSLNGLMDEGLAWMIWDEQSEQKTERETILLDVIGAYDLLIMQGLPPEKAHNRLGLTRNRDELVWELDLETARRIESSAAN